MFFALFPAGHRPFAIANFSTSPLLLFTLAAATACGGLSAGKSNTFVNTTAPLPLSITTQTLSSATVGNSYSVSLTATGGVPPYSWAISSGALPGGLSLTSSTGVLSGTTDQTGTFPFQTTVTDAQATSAAAPLSILVLPNTTAPLPLSITTQTLSSATVGSPYSVSLTATGGVSPYSWAISSGALPDGLSLTSSTGVLSGTTDQTGTFPFQTMVTDAQATSAATPLSILVLPDAPAPPPLSITTQTLSSATAASPYSVSLTATGGVPPYSWEISSGALPGGFSLASGTGVLSGTTDQTGTFPFQTMVTDSQGASALASLSFMVLASMPQLYVNANTGSDTYDCTSAVFASESTGPCLTIAHAEALSAAGDTINIAAGVYRLTTGTNGHYTSAGGQIAVKNDQTFTGPACTPTLAPCTAILSGSVQLTPGQIQGPDGDGNYYATGFTQQGNNAGFSCDTLGGSGGGGWPGCNNAEDLYVNGGSYQHMNVSSEVTLAAGTWWFNHTTNTIYLPSTLTPIFVGANTVEVGVLNSVFSPAAAPNGVTVENFTVEEFASEIEGGAIDPNYGVPAAPTAALNWTVQNNYVTLNHGTGIRPGFATQILNNVVTNNGNLGIGGGLPAGAAITPSGLVVQGNTATNNNYAHVSPGFGAGCMKFGNTANAIIRGNSCVNNIGNGIHFDVNSVNPLIDGNTIADNVDSAATGGSGYGIICEISELGCTIRNNAVRFVGTGGAVGIFSSTSSGVQAYCNVISEPSGVTDAAWEVAAGNRGNNLVPPNQGAQIVSAGNYFHHNTVIWDTGTGLAGYVQVDVANQPTFFADNTPPDYNAYHASSTSVWQFVYDNNNSADNKLKTFANYQAAGADVHGTMDMIYTNDFPSVAITSPADQSSVTNGVTVTATASDTSGIASASLYLDWTLVSTTSSAGPFSFSLFNLAQGTHVIAVMALAVSGVRNCNAITVTQTATPQSPTGLVPSDRLNRSDHAPRTDELARSFIIGR
jgi:hypothetical protein